MTQSIRSALVTFTVLLAAASGASAATWLEDGERSSGGERDTTDSTDSNFSNDANNGNADGWVNQRTGVVGTFTGAEPRPDSSGRECREYSFTAQIAGGQQEIFGVACREPDGSWQEASDSFNPPLEARSEVREPYRDAGPQPAPYTGWDRWYAYPSIGLSASYCFSGFCFGSGYSTGDSYYGYPGYRYRDYGYGRYGYRNHSYRNHSYRYPSYYSNFGFRFGHSRHGHNRHYGKHRGSHHVKRHSNHSRNRHSNRHGNRHSKRHGKHGNRHR